MVPVLNSLPDSFGLKWQEYKDHKKPYCATHLHVFRLYIKANGQHYSNDNIKIIENLSKSEVIS